MSALYLEGLSHDPLRYAYSPTSGRTMYVVQRKYFENILVL